MKESTTKQVENGQQGYGYLFWGGPQGTFRAAREAIEAAFQEETEL